MMAPRKSFAGKFISTLAEKARHRQPLDLTIAVMSCSDGRQFQPVTASAGVDFMTARPKARSPRKAATKAKTTQANKTVPKAKTAKKTATTPKTQKKAATKSKGDPSQLIDARIEELGDWRGTTLAQVRDLIRQAVPTVIEEWKWRGVPVWYQDGMICTCETYKAVVKVTFAKGAALSDPKKLFNASLEGNARRAIDIHEGEKLDTVAFKALVHAAVDLNARGKSRKA
jgi:hypothetical protein